MWESNLQRSRWAWRRSSSQCDRSCCHCRLRCRGSLPSPAQTAAHKSWSAHSPPSYKKKKALVKDITKKIIFTSRYKTGRVFLVTYAPHSTFRERMFSIPHSMMFWQLAVNSIRLPWKCSWSYTVICKNRWSQSKFSWKHKANLHWGIISHLSYLPRSHRHRVCLGHFGLFFFRWTYGEKVHPMTEKVEKATHVILSTMPVDDKIHLLN